MEYRKLSKEEYGDAAGRILYEDNHLLIVNKKVGEIVQGDKTNDETLCDYYKAFIAERDSKPGQVFLGVPHRLDRPVSGVTVLAKTSKALERMNGLFRSSAVCKFYWALTCSAPAQEHAVLTDYLVRNEQQNKTYIYKGDPGKRKDAKLAMLEYLLLGRTERYCLLEIRLMTGRHHQIRCQLAGMGCIIKGDLKYGASRSNPDGGICLHARRIGFVHPVKGVRIEVEAPVPASWMGVGELVSSGRLPSLEIPSAERLG